MDTEQKFVKVFHNWEEGSDHKGIGDCIHCGYPKENSRHPHVFSKAYGSMMCVCGFSWRALCHQIGRI